MERRDFIKLSVGLTGLLPAMQACNTGNKIIPGSIIGASSGLGHMIRDKVFADPDEITTQKVVIVGGGVSGLSAARCLTQAGIDGITLLDLEAQMGGNAASGGNAISRYPWGAHYVPLPNNELTEYLSFLESCNVITGWDEKGLPVYNEFHLCQDPEERLYINGRWQEGLVPHFGLNSTELAEFSRFFSLMKELRYQKGSDGKDAFAIPVDQSSKDEQYVRLDQITMKDWMEEKGFTNTYIRWYVDYCTRDDFGTPYDRISAWAGIHYFASRKGKGNNAAHHDVLTWEQGNGFLVEHLLQQVKGDIRNGALVTAVKDTGNGVQVNYYDVQSKKLVGIKADHCIIATPHFVAARLLQDTDRLQAVQEYMEYAPWMIANLTVGPVQERSGAGESWDNVIYGSRSLGYVDATHQQVQQVKPKRNLTYYLPLTEGDPATARKNAMGKTHEQWTREIIGDLKRIHTDIEQSVEHIDIMLWGHAMAQPRPGWIHGDVRHRLGADRGAHIHFAHTDMAGISIFEEAFYQGIKAARKITGV